MSVESQESRVKSRSTGLTAGAGARPSLLAARSSRGLTLIELLVVIIILTTLVAAAIPLLSPTNDDRRLREASRGLNSFIAGAQARAIQLQRPFGIALKKLSQDTGRDDPTDKTNDNGICVEVFYAEQPAPFTGFDETSAARVALYTPATRSPPLYGGTRPLVLIQLVARGNTYGAIADGLPVGWDADSLPGVDAGNNRYAALPGGVVKPGDVIEIGGTQYQLLSDTNDSDIDVRLDSTGTYFASNTGKVDNNLLKPTQVVAWPMNDTGQMLNVKYNDYGDELGTPLAQQHEKDHPVHRYWTEPSSYRILRQPTITSDPPYQLPEGTAIDLRASGSALQIPAVVNSNTDIDGFFHKPESSAASQIDNSEPVFVMFSPEGPVERLHMSNEPIDSYNGANEAAFYDGPVVQNLFLLVGRRESTPPPEADDPNSVFISGLLPEELAKRKALHNWLLPESRWVVIGARTGRVVTAENAYVDPVALAADPANTNDPPLVRRARQIREARTFAREMTQLGGR